MLMRDASRLDIAGAVKDQARAARLARLRLIAGLLRAHDELARRELADVLDVIDTAEVRLIGRVFKGGSRIETGAGDRRPAPSEPGPARDADICVREA
ncbi:MAG: hypothetical protein Q8R92_03450, partial [Deltaproteobacteria bacterium]|nr:hypothetical protein [Deltaproteobacteria bacterium]